MPPYRGAIRCGAAMLLGAATLAAQPRTAASSGPSLAVVAGRPITAGDLDAKAKEAAAGLDADLAKLKRQSLEDAVDFRLLEIEGRRRHTSGDQVYFTEVIERIATPSAAQLQAEYDRDPAWKARGSLAQVQEWLSGTMMESQESGLYRAWCARARERTRVRLVADLDGPGVRPDTTLALVGREPVRASDVSLLYEPRRNAALRRLYGVQRAALEAAVRERLLADEAARREVTRDDLLRAEITDKVQPVGDAEIADFYEKNRSEFEGDLAANRGDIAEYLQGEAREEAENRFYRGLATAADVRVSLAEPPPLRVAIRTADSPSRGPSSAPVTIVEFGDFECHPCGRAYPMVEEVLKSYGDRVRLVFRQYPLWMHPHARRAAEAALASDAQGRFWPYADRLFHNQNALDDASLRVYAAEIGLDRERFGTALASRSFGAAVVRDVREGRSYGAVGTPSFFVNGVRLPSPDPEAFRRAIDDALAKSAPAPAPP